MAEELIERRVRAGLPITRLMTAIMPLPLTRWILQRSLGRARLPAGWRRESASAAGVPCEWLSPAGAAQAPVLLYLHGGGFVMGLTFLHLEMVATLARQMGLRALMVDYRLAPEHPFPAALEDCVAAYRWLLTQGIPADQIVLAGDSAGGNLVITTLMKLRDEGDPLPAAGACLSPVTDLSGQKDRGYDPLLHPRAIRLFNRSYIGPGDPRDPLISPVFGEWRGLPPLLIHAGEDEVLCEDAQRAADLAAAAGLEARLEIYPRMWHVWQLNLELPQAAHSLDDIAQFLGARLGVPATTP